MKQFQIKSTAATLGLSAALALGAVGCGGSTDDDPQTIKVGLIAAQSGPAAAFGGPQRASMEAAVDRINEQGGAKVGDKQVKLELKTYDHAYDPTKAVTAAQQAISKDGVAFLQVDGGAIVSAVQPIAEKNHVPIMALAGGDHYLGKQHPETFRLYYDIPRSFGASLSVLKKKIGGSGTVLGVFTDDELGKTLAEQSDRIAKSQGFTSSSVFVSRDATDFAPLLNKVLPKKPDIIQFGGTPPSQYAAVVKTARQLGYKGTFIFPDTVYLPAVLKAAGAKGVAGSAVSPYFGSLATTEGKYWTENISNYKAGDPSQGWSALAYDNLFLLKSAIEKSQSTKAADVVDALDEVSIEGALGHFRYSGADRYGLARVIEIDFPVAVVQPDGTLKGEAVVSAAEADAW